MVRVTCDHLRRMGACYAVRLSFEQIFPEGATLEDLPRALRAGLDVLWLLEGRDLSPADDAAFTRVFDHAARWRIGWQSVEEYITATEDDYHQLLAPLFASEASLEAWVQDAERANEADNY